MENVSNINSNVESNVNDHINYETMKQLNRKILHVVANKAYIGEVTNIECYTHNYGERSLSDAIKRMSESFPNPK
jgi:hypothetical protein